MSKKYLSPCRAWTRRLDTLRSIVLCALCAPAVNPCLAGDLNPPVGPVAPTHKTLTQVEPRTAINATNTPGDANSLFRIAQPGSYYLTGNITGVAGRHGIEIGASNVTLDLNGFAVVGVASSLDGITVDGSHDNLTVRNGAVTQWAGAGVELTIGGTGTGAIVEQVHALGNGLVGVRVPSNSIVVDCVSSDNGGVGFNLSTSATISGCIAATNAAAGYSSASGVAHESCIARQNTTSGFAFSNGCTFLNCTSASNTGAGFEGGGVGSACTFTNCASVGNTGNGYTLQVDCTLQGCTARSNGGHGFSSGSNFLISGCTATFNTLSGIRAGGGAAIVLSNVCSNNGNNGDGAGILLLANGSRVEGNNCLANDRGIDVDSTGNIIIRNTCRGNTTNWDVVAGNVCLVVSASTGGAILGNAGGAAPGSTDPNVNFSY